MPESQRHYSDGMSTEMLMRNVFGDKYYGNASAYQNPRYFKRDVRLLVKKLRSDVNDLIASENFKAAVSLYLDRIDLGLKTASSEDDFRVLLVYALDVISILIGYHYQAGGKVLEPYFIPSTWQDRQGWEEANQYYTYKDHLMEKKKQLIKQLKGEGHTNAEVRELMNMNKYRFAQILRLIRDEGKAS